MARIRLVLVGYSLKLTGGLPLLDLWLVWAPVVNRLRLTLIPVLAGSDSYLLLDGATSPCWLI